MDVQVATSIAPIVRDLETARAFYERALGLSLEGGDRLLRRPGVAGQRAC